MQGAGSDIQNDNPLVMLKHIEARCSPWGPVISHFVEKVPWQRVCNSCAMGQVLPSYQRLPTDQLPEFHKHLRLGNLFQELGILPSCYVSPHQLLTEKVEPLEPVPSCTWFMLCPWCARMWSSSDETKAKQRAVRTLQPTFRQTLVLLSSRHHSGLSNQISSSRSFRPGHVCSAWPQLPENVGETCRQ